MLHLSLCLPNSTIGTATRSTNSTFGTENEAMQIELNHIVLYVYNDIVWSLACIHWIPIVSQSSEPPAHLLLLICQSKYLGILKNNLAFTGLSTNRAKSWQQKKSCKDNFSALGMFQNSNVQWQDKHNILYNKQFGFRQGYGTNMALIEFVNNISLAFEEKKNCSGSIFRFSKSLRFNWSWYSYS